MQHAKTLALCITIAIGSYLVGRATLEARQPPLPRDQQYTPRTVAADARTPISSLPFTIDQCGSYFLTGCLTGAPGENGITIRADDVTIDLNGFRLRGVKGSLNGISVPNAQSNITVMNGVIRDFGISGINCLVAENTRVESVVVLSNDQDGVLAGANAHVRNCVVRDNSLNGVMVKNNSIVSSCSLSNNAAAGLSVGNSSVVSGCVISDNGQAGISAGESCVIQGSTLRGNAGPGIASNRGSVHTDCSATFNTTDGIRTIDSLVRGNTAISNSTNFAATTSVVIENR